MLRELFLEAGEDESKVVIGGCPRLNRDLMVSVKDGREIGA